MTAQVVKLKEQWSPTTIQATFAFHLLSSRPTRAVSINLPLLNDLGWTFTLLLTPEHPLKAHKQKSKSAKSCRWVPAVFSFRQRDSTIPWENTSMHAQLVLGSTTTINSEQELTPHDDVLFTSLGAIEGVLAQIPSAEVRLTGSHTLSLSTQVRITVTISDCPFANGLFQPTYSHVTEANSDAQVRLVRQSGDRVLSRSLASGKLFDVKFLTSSTRPTSGDDGELLPTYASLPVLEDHVNICSAKIGEEWTSALAAVRHRDNTGAKYAGEIVCPKDWEYESDSDFEDEDDSVEPCASSQAHEQSNTGTSNSSLSSFEMDGASDQDLVDCLHEEVIKDPEETVTADSEQAILIGFAAHRTWHAFLWYCYAGRLEFSKLKSQAEPGTLHLRVTHPEDGPPSCSPKSMYRLADLVGDNVLKAKALAAIRERMTEANILDETFSIFTSRHPDVRDALLDVLMDHCGSPHVKKAFLKTMSRYNNMPHAEPVLSAFYDRLAA